MNRHRFTLIELAFLIGALVLVMGMFLPPQCKSREKARRINCAGNLKQIGFALLMYSGEFDGYFPNNTGNGTNFNLLNRKGYLSNGKVFGCPSQTKLRTTADVSNYRYIGSGLKDDNDDPSVNSLACDQSGNHPGNAWMNVLFIDGHASGHKPRTAMKNLLLGLTCAALGFIAARLTTPVQTAPLPSPVAEFAEETEPLVNSAAADGKGTHPGNAWMNVKFIDGRPNKPSTSGFEND